MIKAIRLSPNKTILDLDIGGIYAATYRSGTFYLNENIRAKSPKPYQDGELKAVKVVKINVPDTVTIVVIEDEFVLAQDTYKSREDPFAVVPEKVKPERTTFSWEHPVLESMRADFIKAATMIRNAIYNNVPIIIRHHNDGDGISAGLALERAIRPLIIKEHHDYSYRYFSRSTSRTPYYDFLDAQRDIENSLNFVRRFSSKLPLIILADMGSGEENLLSLKLLRFNGMRSIVVDHHSPGEEDGSEGQLIASRYSNLHLNPFLHGSDSRWAAGILCYELARFINKEFDEPLLPAVSGMSDKTDAYEPAILQNYMRGLDPEFLKKLIRSLDFISQSSKWLEVPSLFNALLGHDQGKQEELVSMIYPRVQERIEGFQNVVKHYARVTEMNGVRLVELDLDRIGFQGDYPGPGRITAIALDTYSTGKTIVVGMLSGLVIFRSELKSFDAIALLAGLRKELPHALVSGGGHKAAASFRFLPAAHQDVIEKIRLYVKGI